MSLAMRRRAPQQEKREARDAWSEWDMTYLGIMFKKGYTLRLIAHRLSRTIPAINGMIVKLRRTDRATFRTRIGDRRTCYWRDHGDPK